MNSKQFRNIGWKENQQNTIIVITKQTLPLLMLQTVSECKHVALGPECVKRAQQTI